MIREGLLALPKKLAAGTLIRAPGRKFFWAVI